ncbi:MAG: hypothetical protein U0133_10915 [Gemmatimonadales bacterium]
MVTAGWKRGDRRTAEEFVRGWKGSTSDLLQAFTTGYWAKMNQPARAASPRWSSVS